MRKILRGHVFNKRFLFTLCLGFSFFVEAHAQVSGTYTINSTLPTGGTNFQTFSAAVAYLSSGVNGPVIFNVAAGTGPYNEQVILNNITGTSATNTITFNCNGVTLKFLSTNSAQRAGVKLKNTKYVTFDNLTVLPQAATTGQYGFGFHLLNDADNNTIKNCHITNNVDWSNPDNHEGIVINGNDNNSYDDGYSNCDNNLIQGNTISGGSVGITLSSLNFGFPTVFMNGNRVSGNTITNTIVYGIQMYNTSGTTIDGNDISGGPDATGDLYGMYVAYYNQAFNITGNRIHAFHVNSGKKLFGITIGSESVAGKDCYITNNLIYDFQSDFDQFGIISSFATGVYSGSYINIYHNTISLDDQTVAGSNSYGLYLDTVTDVAVVDNIISITRKTSISNYGIYFNHLPINYSATRNNYYVPKGPAFICAIGKYGPTAYTTMPAWQTASGTDYYSMAVDPQYTSLAGFNFIPTAQLLDNMGKPVGILTDIAANSRSTTTPDPGCYEFVSTPCSTTITGGTTTVAPDSILCQGPKVAFGLSGNTAGGGQTYTFQTSTTATGTYTAITGALGYPYTELTPTTTLYYRIALTCGGTTAYSTPLRVLVNNPLNAGTYTINNALPTGGVNFNSFRDATLALGCGFTGAIVFNVAAGSGPYNEQINLPALATSATKTITFNGNGAKVAFAVTNTNESAVIKLNGADYITFDSLNVDVQGTGGFGFGIQLLNNADHNTIKRCKINLSTATTSNYYAGILINPSDYDPVDWVSNSNCDSNLITGNTITGGYYGISAVSNSINKSDVYSFGNVLTKNTLLDNLGYGIYISGAGKMLVDSNDISQPTRSIFAANPYVGVYAFQSNYGLTISRNRVHNISEKGKSSIFQIDGIKFEKDTCILLPAYPNTVSNNAIYNFKGNGLQHGLYTLSCNYTTFYHNTIALDDTSATTSSPTRGFGLFGNLSTGVELKNNNIVIKRGGTGDKYCIFMNIPDNNFKANYNNYYLQANSGSTNFTGRYFNTDYISLPNWLATHNDSSSVAIDPVFYDNTVGDLTPTKIAFENKGIGVGVPVDILNAARNTTNPDIGAVEFTICRPLNTPVLTVDSSGVNAIRFAWTAVPGTTGYRVSRDGGVTWIIPSSGSMGTTHTVVALSPRDTVKLMVKAFGTRIDCPEYISSQVTGYALTDGIFVPNTFTPNNDSHNDVFKVYSNIMKSVHWMVFNQWGEKVFETAELNASWDGNFKGKPQPIGVYVYVVVGTLSDGTTVTKKGTFNLIR